MTADLKVSNNPFLEYTEIDVTELTKPYTISLFDSYGNVLLRETSYNSKYLLQGHNLSIGVYFISIRNSNGIKQLKLVKQ